jgi:hypothetical protein
MIRSPPSRSSPPINCPAGLLQPMITHGLKLLQLHPTTTHSHTNPLPKGSLWPSSADLALLATTRVAPTNARCTRPSQPNPHSAR